MEITPHYPKRSRVGRVCVMFNGVVYSRYPNAKGFSDRMYFRCKSGDKKKGFDLLHRDVWRRHHGPIPKGFEIHHKDENTENNAIDNLEMLSKADHLKKHIPSWKQRQAISWAKKTKEERDAIRKSAAPWHGTPEGREWHSKHAKEIGFGIVEPSPCVCNYCQKDFMLKSHKKENNFCSNNCKSAMRRRMGSDLVSHKCAECGKEYRRNKYFKNSGYCSHKCLWIARSPKIEIKCESCGKAVMLVPSRVGKIRCCSRRCGGKRSRELTRTASPTFIG